MVVCFSGLIFRPAPAQAALITIGIQAVVDDVIEYGDYLNESVMRQVTAATWAATVQAATDIQNIRSYKLNRPWWE